MRIMRTDVVVRFLIGVLAYMCVAVAARRPPRPPR
jgi:hypothetical protein